MALSIRNKETVALAREVAARTGQSVTKTIHDALAKEKAQLAPLPVLRPETEAFLKQLHAEMQSKGSTGLKADKAFFDSLYDE
ncbi:MAG: type II toxin-antitoxin system VapB family antitoxin [Methylocystis sp.]|nr:type II toxin-antitoxin system VapB family antitoxin [Methylocystis sp.]MCA3582235.1 type II toxin-antitoxin system VapB family antitoxin [Methylocystis sp.]MCA3588130.1 type II toxin-antitoxin system VapB family antitoxin [Methylocystis sp.]MCA3590048.1 type II toxin-antitoxin system VapB family antitoxin [Methylocystis sp.]